MSGWACRTVLVSTFVALFCSPFMAQTDSGWRISPYHLNIQVGDDRYLQLLNDSAQELRGAASVLEALFSSSLSCDFLSRSSARKGMRTLRTHGWLALLCILRY